jgi:ADP-ribosylglycohydrolase
MTPEPADSESLLSRYRGALLGLATGDAVGTTLEFKAPGTFTPVDGMFGGGPFHLHPGEWTDDTSMALCLAESLIQRQGFDAVDQLRRYLRWWHEGHLSSTGVCFDIGNTVQQALERFERTGAPFCGPTEPGTAGNGSLMRLAPVPLAFAEDPEAAVDMAGRSSRTTHGVPAAVDACRYFAGLLVGALQGRPRDELLAPRFSPVPGLWERQPLAPEVDAVAAGSFRTKEPPAIRGSGYVVDCLEAALWAFDRGQSFREGCLLAANLGDDADTTAAVFGQLAGAHWGEEGIPPEWLKRLARREVIEAMAQGLHDLSRGLIPGA